jgi:hypothetical protein
MLGCPIRKFADQFVCANPRNLSQLITSFIVSESLGIPHTLLICLLYFLLFNELFKFALYTINSVQRLLYYCFFRILKYQYVNELSGPLIVESQALRIAL